MAFVQSVSLGILTLIYILNFISSWVFFNTVYSNNKNCLPVHVRLDRFHCITNKKNTRDSTLWIHTCMTWFTVLLQYFPNIGKIRNMNQILQCTQCFWNENQAFSMKKQQLTIKSLTSDVEFKEIALDGQFE